MIPYLRFLSSCLLQSVGTPIIDIYKLIFFWILAWRLLENKLIALIWRWISRENLNYLFHLFRTKWPWFCPQLVTRAWNALWRICWKKATWFWLPIMVFGAKERWIWHGVKVSYYFKICNFLFPRTFFDASTENGKY